jgi:TRAP-type mannitol/chloroaromatic compound transport system permease small subunit
VWVLLLLAIVANVTLRYVFGAGRVEFEELQWHLYALGFLAGLSYGVQADAHIRVDVVSERLSPRTRAWIDLYGTLLLLLPFVALIVVYGVPFAWHAWESGEISPSPGGLPYRWIIKASLPLGFALLGLATCARIARVSSLLFGRARPSPEGAAREPGA